ncbi:CD209 antigen-like protein E isoform X2 [Lepisosteus oculatus]|uniref:CD209 antigen-like protein E isoform X2 n=1 Tax=Lepisosteus oculatus TaxID=7918 RepID=UPI00073FF757|nr:PREDICTED: CD209 antigen-like protein E isoform X2 [Lepisosteus oculatus]
MSDSDDYENYDFYQRTTLEQQGQARGRNVQPGSAVWMNPICLHILLLIVIFIWTVLIIVVFTKFSHVSSAVNKVESEISLLNNKNSALTKEIQWLKDYACAAKLCPCDWAQINGTCYYLSKNSTDWSGAKQNCKALGSNLTIVYRTEELEHLSNIICWLTDIDLKGNKSWLNGTPGKRNQMSSDFAKELDPHNGP